MRQWMMIGLLCLASCWSRGVGGAKAESEKGPPPIVLGPTASVDDVLTALHDDGKLVKSFIADVRDDEIDEIQGTDFVRIGKVSFKFNANGNAVMHLILDRKQAGGKIFNDKIDYLLDNGWLIVRTFATKKEIRIQLVPPGKKVNLFEVGKGPFPLPIGQDPKDVQKQFDVSIPPPDKDNPDPPGTPPGTIHLLLKPKPGTPLDQDFMAIDVWVDCKTKMPVQVRTENKKQSARKVWNLDNLKVNPQIDDQDLKLPPLPPGWDSSDQPLAK